MRGYQAPWLSYGTPGLWLTCPKVLLLRLSPTHIICVHMHTYTYIHIGVGRSGTFIVIDSMLERMKHKDHNVDIYGHVSLLRAQRNYMVQTEVSVGV